MKLLACDTAARVKDLVESDEYFATGSWKPYGGRTNNAGQITGQMIVPENALIEKITNSIDAILMRKCMEQGIDPKDQDNAPKDMEQAIQRYFGGRDEIRKKRSEFAKELIRISAEGRKDMPTITVIDSGEGQAPDEISKTILSLSENIKEQIKFVYGTYNQGGSSALSFSYDTQNYHESYVQLVLCRRAQTIANKGADSSYFGFTLVRSRFLDKSNKFTYEYFVNSEGEIPRFPFVEPITINGYDFSEGCVVRLYDYQLSNTTNILFRGLNESIEKKLSYSPLPMFLQELRPYKGDTEYTIFGFREKMERKAEDKIMHPGFPADYPVDLGEIGKKAVRVFVLQHKSLHNENIDSYLSQKEKVFFIRNGMTLHSENASWLRESCGLTDLAPYLFIFVDISEISPALANMLHSGREQFRDTETTRLTLSRLKIFLESFKDLDREYGNLTASDSEVEDKDLKKQLAKEAAKDPELKKIFDLGDDFTAEEKRGTEKTPWEGEYLPTKFELVGLEHRYVEKKSFSKISFRTEAVDNLFQRSADRGEYDWSETDKFYITFQGIHRGVVTFRVDPKPYIETGAKSAVTFTLKVPSKNICLSKALDLELINTPEYEGEPFPFYFRLTNKVFKIPVGTERKLVLSTDVADDYFTRSKDKGEIKVETPPKIEMIKYGLSNGFLTIKIKHSGNKIEKLNDIKILITDPAGHKFEIAAPIEVVPPNYDPNLRLPELKTITRENWDNVEPKYEVQNIARIPNWTKFDRIEINMDSIIFEEFKQLGISDREKAREFLRNQIYINSIWLYLELKNFKSTTDDSSEVKTEVFDMATRGMRKLLLNNLKKLIR